MSVRMRHTRSHTRNRRSHHALTDGALVVDKDTGSVRQPHRIDEATGMYRGMQIITPKVKSEKKSKKEGRAERSVVEVADTTPEGAKKEQKKPTLLGKVTKARSNTRSGFGGGA
ncbi:50S ribosomal protein L32 [Patescibacteria group bacterium]|nr:50S ribosomal protein L32 [Patescibacteria group bacterium]MBU1501068.1 50S ribosomal protein L32 [Patescibacteria group bacterium]MBU2330261.1 50S ribosomal protein L32 [Patescibacteria group bacterium]